jgi:uncharacterized paraquat-inducible protein A
MRTTHISNYQAPKNGRNVYTECQSWVESADIAKRADDATCPECQTAFKRLNEDSHKTAEEMFG